MIGRWMRRSPSLSTALTRSNEEAELETARKGLEDVAGPYLRRRGTRATIVAYRVFAKELKWCDEKGHGSVTANAKDHVFSERVTTTTHE